MTVINWPFTFLLHCEISWKVDWEDTKWDFIHRMKMYTFILYMINHKIISDISLYYIWNITIFTFRLPLTSLTDQAETWKNWTIFLSNFRASKCWPDQREKETFIILYQATYIILNTKMSWLLIVISCIRESNSPLKTVWVGWGPN